MIMITSRVARLAATAAIALSAHTATAQAPHNPARFDLSALPSYTKTQRVTGVMRIYGTPLEDLVGRWANAFRGYHGQVRLQNYLINTSQAFAGLVTGRADIGLMGHRTWHASLMAFDKASAEAPIGSAFRFESAVLMASALRSISS